jgi:DMSO reductase anchor subunit
MKAERYQILSLAYTGQLAQEEAELRLASLGRRERRFFRVIFTAAVLVALAAIVIVFHLEDKVRMIAFSILQSLEDSALFRETYVFLRSVRDAL